MTPNDDAGRNLSRWPHGWYFAVIFVLLLMGSLTLLLLGLLRYVEALP